MGFDAETRLATPAGSDLRLFTRRASRKVRAAVQINHGVAEHAARYAGFADFLSENGFDVYAHDHRGHGATTAPGAPLGHIGPKATAGTLLKDVEAVHRHIAQERAGLPIIIFGHSMGAMIALNYALRNGHRLAGAAIWNAPLATRAEALAGKAVLVWERFRLGSDVPSRLLPKLTFAAWARAFPDRRTDADWLSRDESEVDKYIADPLSGWEASIGLWTALFDLSLKAADSAALEAARKTLPFMLVGGSEDPSTKGGKIVRKLESRLRESGFSNLETTIYDGFRHESLNEIGRERAMEDFVRWAGKFIN
ncbi:alpha/beta hydrolase [Nitratireductor sp. L1-7-SE]|uniref:Alpha/beta hydrolase n=1 Tax=Nitratireductor rhodophyticola TaxID=2854036 RepID=A0ABS7R4F4_9HYPH|nr:alpha/beta hydrolase [Nitratireductor rhodophyticola]MBY8915806.1 alpha/beta hydrolase [Nitratireductor rhodophyticola]MBY8919125.1 alpha/beta hydrolase [Nitratireductor rhodophyticola]